MVEKLLEWLSSIQSAASLLATVYLTVALTAALAIAAIPRPWPHVIKLLGSIAVIGLSLAANSPFVYGISVFVVATLVTDLEFLEKLAAIVWNRKEYWKYLIDRATPREVEAKRAEEALEAGVAAPLPPSGAEQLPPGRPEGRPPVRTHSSQATAIEFARNFEEQVFHALRQGTPPFRGAVVDVNVRVQSARSAASRPMRILDAVVRLNGAHFVIEIKAYRSRQSLHMAVDQVHALVNTYRAALAERGETPQVTPVLVVPAELEVDTVRDGIAVLRFDTSTGQFTNVVEAAPHLGLQAK
jgi:hypothetical protein